MVAVEEEQILTLVVLMVDAAAEQAGEALL
jgi:hypothetical protein